jgi:hypothetical protein
MAARRITIEIDIDLDKYSKAAHEVTVEKVAREVAQFAATRMKAQGYTIESAKARLILHYVRHVVPIRVVSKSGLRIVKKASNQ